MAPPVEGVERIYTLEEVRDSSRLRDKLRRVDLDAITFDTGSAAISRSQIGELSAIGQAIEDVLSRNPNEIFLVEGHTDAVGSDVSNLALSDRRAESVAIVLSENFDIPPENLVTQGYGEQYLKVPTETAERSNRRVAVRRITPLIQSTSR
nr:OmpA family protein [Afifella marina]